MLSTNKCINKISISKNVIHILTFLFIFSNFKINNIKNKH